MLAKSLVVGEGIVGRGGQGLWVKTPGGRPRPLRHVLPVSQQVGQVSRRVVVEVFPELPENAADQIPDIPARAAQNSRQLLARQPRIIQQ